MAEINKKKVYIVPKMIIFEIDNNVVVRTSDNEWKSEWGQGTGDYYFTNGMSGGEL